MCVGGTITPAGSTETEEGEMIAKGLGAFPSEAAGRAGIGSPELCCFSKLCDAFKLLYRSGPQPPLCKMRAAS